MNGRKKICFCMLRSLLIFSLLDAQFFVFLPGADALKALFIVPNIWHSHLVYAGKLADILADAGHEVHFIVPIVRPDVDTGVIRSPQVRVRHYQLPEEKMAEIKRAVKTSTLDWNFSSGIPFITRSITVPLFTIRSIPCLDIAANEKFVEELRRERYDIGLSEAYDICSHNLYHLVRVGATVVTEPHAYSPMLSNYLGIPLPPYVPSLDKADWNAPNLSLMKRTLNALEVWDELSTMEEIHQMETEEFRAMHGDDFPTMGELLRRASFVFVNSNEHLEIGRPLSAKIRYIGGIAMRPVQPLEPRLERIVQNTKRGIVLMSFGTILDTTEIPWPTLEAIMDTFGHVISDYEVIWRMSGDIGNLSEALAQYPNIHPFQWIDQNSLLANNKTVLFISHCGLNSVNEASRHGIPLVCIPVFGDQNYNTACVKHQKVGVALDKRAITTETLGSAILEVLNQNNNYTRNMRRLSRKLAAAPFQPREVFLRNVEYAAAFPGDHFAELDLPEPSALPPCLQFGWDIFCVFLIAIILIYWTVQRALSTIFGILASSKNETGKNKRHHSNTFERKIQ